MQKFILALRFRSRPLPFPSHNCHSYTDKPLLSFFISSFTLSQNRACSSTPQPNSNSSVLVDYLINSLKFSNSRALSVSSRYSHIKSLEKPEAVVHFFNDLGFSDAQIQSLAHVLPKILFSNVEMTLKPKIALFQEIGLHGPHLGAFVSNNPIVVNCGLDRSLKPCICLIRKVLENDGSNRSHEKVNHDLFRVLKRYSRIFRAKSRLESIIPYLQSCGIVGSQLSWLLLFQTRIFASTNEKLTQLVSRALDMGLMKGSRMLVYGIGALYGMRVETLSRKLELFRHFGFSYDESLQMFTKAPYVIAISETKLRCGFEFFLDNLKLDKSVLLRRPMLLFFNIKETVYPRYKVLEILKSKKLLRKDIGITTALFISKEQFLEKYILRFGNYAEELLLAYNGQLLGSSKTQ